MGRAPILIFALAGGMLAGRVAGQVAQEEGPVVVGERRTGWKGVELYQFNAAFDFLGQYRNDRLKQAGGETIVERESLLRETLDLTAGASIGHRNLIDLSGSGQFGLDYRTLDGNLGQESDQWSFLDLFDVRALMLASGAAPTTVYARREEDIFDQGFGGRIDQTIEEEGIISEIRSEVAPTRLQYFHRRQKFDNAFEQSDGLTEQDTFTGQSNVRITKNQRLDVAYTFDRIDEQQGTGPGAFTDAYDRHDANIVHTLGFGPEARSHELRSSLRIYDQGGRFDQSDVRLDELLVLRHSDRLETRYSATADDRSNNGLDQKFYRGEASVRHKLFDSLVSTASVGAQQLSAPENFTSDDVFVTGGLDYTKNVPLGRLNAAVGISYDAQDNSERGTPLSITNDPVVFNDPLPIILQRRNIVPGSIVLLPPAGFPPYQEGIDYTLRYFPDRVEIYVPPGSAIPSGQPILANYDIGPEPASEIDSLGTSVSARYSLTEGRLRGLSVYSVYRTFDQDLTTADPSSFVIDNFDNLLLGVQFARSGVDVKYEHERRTSEVSPFVTDRIVALYSQPLGQRSTINLEYSHDSTTYPLENNRWEIDRVMGRWIQQITPRLDFNLRLEYRNERDRLRGDTQGFDQILGFNWRKGQTSIFFSFQNTFLDSPGAERTSQFIQLGIRREF